MALWRPSRSRRESARADRPQLIDANHRGLRWRVGVELHYLSTFWDEIWIRALSPWPEISPAYAFAQEDAPYLATADPYAHLSGGLSKCIQRPVGGFGFILGMHHTVGFGDQPARWLLGDQRDDLRAFL